MQTIHVEGMHCAHCEMLVAAELEDRGAHHVQADASSGTVTFEGDISPQAVAEAVSAAGFTLQS